MGECNSPVGNDLPRNGLRTGLALQDDLPPLILSGAVQPTADILGAGMPALELEAHISGFENINGVPANYVPPVDVDYGYRMLGCVINVSAAAGLNVGIRIGDGTTWIGVANYTTVILNETVYGSSFGVGLQSALFPLVYPWQIDFTSGVGGVGDTVRFQSIFMKIPRGIEVPR